MAIPSKFGYKDICKLFKAPKFDQAQADRLVTLYKRTGARYVVPVAAHHDNFDMWDSKYQPRFNSVAISGKDVVGMWQKATVGNGLHFGVASHCCPKLPLVPAFARRRQVGSAGGRPLRRPEPGLCGSLRRDLERAPASGTKRMGDVGPPAFEKNFEDRMKDLIDKYHPDLYYTDGGPLSSTAGLNIVSHLYNESQKEQRQIAGRGHDQARLEPNIAVDNFEFGYPETVQNTIWQSDKTMGAEWYWIRNATGAIHVGRASHSHVDRYGQQER